MNNAAAIIRSLIIYGLCLPLAVYLGYVLAQPWGRGDYAFILAVVSLPLIPLILKWHHLVLILSWNMSMVLFFIQGSPYLWMFMTALSLMLTVFQYILKRDVKFATVNGAVWPLLLLALVIAITAQLTGGIGLASFGGGSYGGKRYIQLFCAIAGYFAITSHRIELGQGNKYVALYFLGTLSMIIGSIAPWIPGSMRMIFALFPVESLEAAFGGGSNLEFQYQRLSGVAYAAVGVMCFILAKYGMQGLLGIGDKWRFLPLQFKGGLGINQPWRILAALGILWVAMMGGYRSIPITLIVLCTVLFFMEGLHRTRWLAVFGLVALLGGAIMLPFIHKMPFTVQRSLSFLPVDVSDEAKQSAETSSEWRLKMWREVIPSIPQYLIVGKGYAIDAREQEMAQSLAGIRTDNEAEGAIRAQDYHNGPLSLLIPLGIFGAIAFLWFMVVGYRILLHNYRYGDPANQKVNAFLLAYFLTKALFFFAIYGSFQNDLMIFTGVVGLSAAVNGGMARTAPAVAKPNPAYLPFRLPKPQRA